MRYAQWLVAVSLGVWLPLDSAARADEQPDVQAHVYKKTEQGELELFIHTPPDWKETDRRPAIVFFYGGGWVAGRIEQFEPQAAHLARRGMVAARADYRVKKRHDVGPRECVEDAKSAVRWLRQNAPRLGIDPARIVAAGGSAGGHIAACTALAPHLEPAGERLDISSQPNALVLFNPVLRFSGIPLLMARIDDDEALGRAISPTLHLTKESPPALILFGSNDRLAPMGDEFLKKSRELGHRAELFTAEGEKHGFFNRPPWQERTLRRMDEFLVSLGYLEDSTAANRDRWEVIPRKAEDRVEVAGERRVTVTVHSPSGIGSATLRPRQGDWPDALVLKLCLKGLESFSVTRGDVTWRVSASTRGEQSPLISLVADSREQSIDRENPYWTEIRFHSEGPETGYFELTLPPKLLERCPRELKIDWIDFYRN